MKKLLANFFYPFFFLLFLLSVFLMETEYKFYLFLLWSIFLLIYRDFFSTIIDNIKEQKNKKIICLTFVFLLIALISLIFSHHIPLSIEKYLFYLFSFSIFLFFLKSGQKFLKIDFFFDYLLLLSAILNILVLLLTVFDVSRLSFQGMNFLVRSYGHNHYVAFLLLILPMVWWRILNPSKSQLFGQKFKIYLEIYLLLSSYLLVLISLSRLGLLIALAQFIIIFLLNKSSFAKIRQQKIIFSLVKSVIFLFIFVSFIFIFLSFPITSNNQKNCFLKLYRKDLCVSITENSRVFYWRQAWLTFKNYPVFGYGLNTFKDASYRFPAKMEQHSSYAHNIFLHNLAEMGVLGGGLFILLILYIYYKSFLIVKKSKNNINKFLYLGACSSLFNALFDFDWHFFGIFLLTLIYLAYILVDQEYQLVKETKSKFWQIYPVFLLVVSSFFSISNVLTITWQKENSKHWLKYTPFIASAVKAPYTESVNTIENYTLIYDLYRYDTSFVFRLLNLDGELDYQFKKNLYLNLAEIDPASYLTKVDFQDWQVEEARVLLDRLLQIIKANNFFEDEYFLNYWRKLELAKQIFTKAQEAYKNNDWENASYFYQQALLFDEYVFFTEQALFLEEDNLENFLEFFSKFKNISPHVLGNFGQYMYLYKENTTKLFVANRLDDFKSLMIDILDQEAAAKFYLIHHLYDQIENKDQLLILEEIESNY